MLTLGVILHCSSDLLIEADCQSDPELPSRANLSGQLVLRLPCFCLLRPTVMLPCVYKGRSCNGVGMNALSLSLKREGRKETSSCEWRMMWGRLGP